MKKSWRTSLGGAMAALAAIAPQFEKLLDGNPATVCDWNVVAGAVGIAFALFSARDNRVSSEDAGAK